MATLKSYGGSWVPWPQLLSTCTPASLGIPEPGFLQEEDHGVGLWLGRAFSMILNPDGHEVWWGRRPQGKVDES